MSKKARGLAKVKKAKKQPVDIYKDDPATIERGEQQKREEEKARKKQLDLFKNKVTLRPGRGAIELAKQMVKKKNDVTLRPGRGAIELGKKVAEEEMALSKAEAAHKKAAPNKIKWQPGRGALIMAMAASKKALERQKARKEELGGLSKKGKAYAYLHPSHPWKEDDKLVTEDDLARDVPESSYYKAREKRERDSARSQRETKAEETRVRPSPAHKAKRETQRRVKAAAMAKRNIETDDLMSDDEKERRYRPPTLY